MVKLHIKDHCIETAAKLEFKKLMDEYFDTNNDTVLLEDKIEVLREFIESTDFVHLRDSDLRLSGEVEIVVFIAKENDEIKIIFS